MPTLETYRKQAKLLMRWHREGNYSIGEKLRVLPRFAALTDREALDMAFPLALAQEVVAVEAGYANWTALKAATADGRLQVARPALVAKTFWGMLSGVFLLPAIYDAPPSAREATAMKKELVQMLLAKYATGD